MATQPTIDRYKTRRGSSNYLSYLTIDECKEIYSLAKARKEYRDTHDYVPRNDDSIPPPIHTIAEMYGTSRATVRRILFKEHWWIKE